MSQKQQLLGFGGPASPKCVKLCSHQSSKLLKVKRQNRKLNGHSSCNGWLIGGINNGPSPTSIRGTSDRTPIEEDIDAVEALGALVSAAKLEFPDNNIEVPAPERDSGL